MGGLHPCAVRELAETETLQFLVARTELPAEVKSRLRLANYGQMKLCKSLHVRFILPDDETKE